MHSTVQATDSNKSTCKCSVWNVCEKVQHKYSYINGNKEGNKVIHGKIKSNCVGSIFVVYFQPTSQLCLVYNDLTNTALQNFTHNHIATAIVMHQLCIMYSYTISQLASYILQTSLPSNISSNNYITCQSANNFSNNAAVLQFIKIPLAFQKPCNQNSNFYFYLRKFSTYNNLNNSGYLCRCHFILVASQLADMNLFCELF